MDILELSSITSVEQIARFNKKFIPEPRLSDLEFVKWKFRESTSDGDNITFHYGLMDQDEIIAEISVQPMTAWIHGSWQKCSYFGDWFRDPDYKGTGAVLMNHIMSGKHSLLAASASYQAYEIYRRREFLLSPIDQRFVYVARPIAALLNTFRTPRRAAGIFLRWNKNPLARIPKPRLEDGLRFSYSERLDPSLLDGWESDAPADTVFVRRELWMFSWFLEKFPFPEFKLVVLIRGEQQIGYVLLHTRKGTNGLIEGKVVDLFARGWNRNHLEALFREGCRELISSGAHIVKYHASHPLFISLAENSNFTKTRDQRVIMHGPIAEAMASPQANLHITYYDHDEAYY